MAPVKSSSLIGRDQEMDDSLSYVEPFVRFIDEFGVMIQITYEFTNESYINDSIYKNEYKNEYIFSLIRISYSTPL